MPLSKRPLTFNEPYFKKYGSKYALILSDLSLLTLHEFSRKIMKIHEGGYHGSHTT